MDFNPLPPHGGRRLTSVEIPEGTKISIHSLRMEGDFLLHRRSSKTFHFNPLPPHGGRLTSPFCISTFSPFQSTPSAWRETSYKMFVSTPFRNFNPLPPHGGRHDQNAYHVGDHVFQSTPSAWRETDCKIRLSESTHHFNPLPPHGGRHIIPGTMTNIF